jgi:4-amino-4-deoxy-L-arabinose transferase-like glycosyltransferase
LASERVDPPKYALPLLLAVFILLGLAASIINPLHEATDELRHYRFVHYIVQEHALPVQGETACYIQSHHPPLFYAIGALATFGIDTGHDVCYGPPDNPFWAYRYWEVGVDNKNQYLHGADESFPWHGEALAAHIVRAINVLMGAGPVYLTWLMGRAIWPKRPYLALGGAAFVAFNPMFVYMAGAINNDVIAALTGTAVTLACLQLVKDESGLSRRWGVKLGVLFGLALLSKFNLTAVALLIAVAASLVAYQKKQWRQWLEVGTITVFVALLLSGWWFVRNQILYGEPTGFQKLTELWGVRDPSDSFGVAVFELSYLWTSLWGRFGYGQIPMPDVIYNVLRWLVGFSFVGLLIPQIRRVWSSTNLHQPTDKTLRVSLLLLGLNVLIFFGVVFNYLLVSPAGPMGRFFFPALPAFSILIFYGLSQWVSFFNHPQAERVTAVLANTLMASLTAVALFVYLAPAYARPGGFADGAVPNPLNAQFDSFVNLRGYAVRGTAVAPGDPIDLDLYWQVTAQPPGNYLLFVHLSDDNGIIVAQRDTHPGLGNFPASQWQPGDRFVESIRLYLPETAYTPNHTTLSVGLYAPDEGYRLGITAADGTSLGDALELAEVAITPLPGEFPNPLAQNFNDEILLQGYEYEKHIIPVGGEMTVTLYWQALQAGVTDYMIEVHVVDEGGGVYETADHRPDPHTDQWAANQQIQSQHHLILPADMPPGSYTIHVALLDTTSQTRQNIVAEDGHWLNDHLLLAKVLVK